MKVSLHFWRLNKYLNCLLNFVLIGNKSVNKMLSAFENIKRLTLLFVNVKSTIS